MHIHTKFSGPCTTPFLSKICRESYSEPRTVYSLLRRRGMDLVTLTDHDSIEGAEQLRCHSDFFVSEELTCRMPSGAEVHIGVYDITERQHVQLQRRRDDLIALLMYLTENRLLFSVNHVFSCLTGKREFDDFGWFRDYFPAIEARNGQMLARQNEDSQRLARQWRKIQIGGSDAHASASAATAYTEVPGARNKEEFFAGLRAGKGRPAGESGNFVKLTRDVLMIGGATMWERPWALALAPLALLVPLATFLNYRSERKFGSLWAKRILGQAQAHRPRWLSAPQSAMEGLT
ncbi:MAG: PHP-associated domain-containing protein [Candidatus Acidiferrales bacterium]